MWAGRFDGSGGHVSCWPRSASVINLNDVLVSGQVAHVLLRWIARTDGQRTKGRVRNVRGRHSELDEAVPRQSFRHLIVQRQINATDEIVRRVRSFTPGEIENENINQSSFGWKTYNKHDLPCPSLGRRGIRQTMAL